MDREWEKRGGGGTEMISPSAIIKRRGFHHTRALTIEEIREIIAQFGESAGRAREAGCDGIEMHAGMGYLINQFLSPITNDRRDEYGGSPENRLRFLLNIVSEVRANAGKDFVCFCRISADEFMEGGLTLTETTEIAKTLKNAGIHCLNVQVGWHESPVPLVQSCVPPGAYTYLAEEIKKAAQIPVVTAYRVNSPRIAEDIICQGKADLVGMARALLADPELPRKAKEGRVDEIRPCIACCRCLDRVMNLESVYCSVNPRLGRETEWHLALAPQPRKVLVVGGGPAGMVAASTAAHRGHKVTLLEKESKLGGQLNFASLPPYKREIEDYRKYLEGGLRRSGVEVKLNTTLELRGEEIDAVIVATGAQPLIPEIAGIERCVTALEVLKGKETGKEVLIIGGGMIGCEVAEYLRNKNKRVVILEMLGRIGADIGPATRWVILGRLRSAGVRIETKAKVVAVTESGVKAEREGKEEEFAADTVVLAAGMVPANETSGKLEALKVYRVGDCVSPRRIKEAVEEGMRVGFEI